MAIFNCYVSLPEGKWFDSPNKKIEIEMDQGHLGSLAIVPINQFWIHESSWADEGFYQRRRISHHTNIK